MEDHKVSTDSPEESATSGVGATPIPEVEKAPGKKNRWFSSLGKFHSFLLILSLLLIPLIGVMAWDAVKSREDPLAKRNTAACELLHGKIVKVSFTTEKKGRNTERFALCEESGTGKILMATGQLYQGKDSWTDSCAGKVFSMDNSDDEGINRSLICLNDGKVTKATTMDLG